MTNIKRMLMAAAGVDNILKPYGSIWGWGLNTVGQLGNGNTTNLSSPVQIGSDTDWHQVVSTYQSTFALKSDGTVWAWGRNNEGQLGQGNTTNTSSPVQVGSRTDWKWIGGHGTGLVLSASLSAGKVYITGGNSQGVQGRGNTTSTSSPVQLGTDKEFKYVSNNNGQVILGTDGSNQMWCMGNNGSGELGIGDTTSRSSPVQLGARTDFVRGAEHGNASSWTMSTGKMYAAGNNGFRKFMDETGTNTSSPVQVGSDTDWAHFRTGGSRAQATMRTNGTLWTGGYGAYGMAGDGTVGVNQASPVQVGSLTTWTGVSFGNHHCLGFQGGKLFSWGRSREGQNGRGNTTSASSPVQVGSLTDWQPIGRVDLASPHGNNLGSYHTVVIRTTSS